MTQEEMDILMAGGDVSSEDITSNELSGHEQKDLNGSDMVHELGSVTADSELKATEIFDKLDSMLEIIDIIETGVKEDNKEKSLSLLSDMRNVIFSTMDTMQYQDIHRQKIERVINTMRSIAKLMNQSLNGINITEEDTNFVPSAKHIAGDDDEDQVDDDELAALIASMGQK